jgi:uncharacterized membrane protein SpoIIM required for sporulation
MAMKMKWIENPLKKLFILMLIVGIFSFFLGYFFSNPIFAQPNCSLNFWTILATNSIIHLKLLLFSFLTLGIYSFSFLFTQFFLVGIFVGGITEARHSLLSALSYFWIHGIFELSAAILTSIIAPFVCCSLFLLIYKKEISQKKLLKIGKQTVYLLLISFFLVLFSAFLETFIAPKCVIFI